MALTNKYFQKTALFYEIAIAPGSVLSNRLSKNRFGFTFLV
jgi:hypothetical protein